MTLMEKEYIWGCSI